MAELEDQIRAWADAAAVAGDSPVRPDEVMGSGGGDQKHQSGRPAARRRRMLAVAAAVLIIAGAIGAFALSRSDSKQIITDGPKNPAATSSVETSPPSSESPQEFGVVFEVLGMGEAGIDTMGALRAEYTQEELTQAWAAAGLGGSPPEVDFAEKVVLSITIPDDACPPTLVEFSRSANGLEPIFREPEGGCIEPLIPKTFVVALDWASTGDSFRIFLPGQPTYGFNDQVLDVSRSSLEDVTLNPAERTFNTALAALQLEGCCGEPSHGGDSAVTGVRWQDLDVPVFGGPIEKNTFDHEGQPRVFVPFNDYVTSSAPSEVGGAPVTTGEADLGAFLAFTCGENLWTLGGAGMGDRSTPTQLRELAKVLIPQLGCTVGARPVAPGHGNPLGD
ncbi:MAG TPA: hypothetical protein VL068_15165 [Microthrixaceae bacterium]|nr:hypothetical protein [Microthrixaceae bacterium]